MGLTSWSAPSATCQHHSLDGDLLVTTATGQRDDVGRRVAVLSLLCASCGEPFRFLGVPGGVGACPHEPTVDEGALELRVPVAPSSVIDLDEQLLCPVHGGRS